MINIATKNQKGEETQVWKLEDYIEYLKESFSFPEEQGLPESWFEENTFTVNGPKGTGKTTLVKRQLAPYLKSLWREKIDFFDAQDIFGTIEAIMKSKKFVHFIMFEDAMREGFDARTAMHGATKISSQLYEVIRHSVDEGYLKAGYIIICIISQIYEAIDFRYRDESAFDIFKAHCRGVDKKIKNEQVISELKYWKDKSRRAKDIRYRKLGYLVDSTGNTIRIHDFSQFLEIKASDIEWIKVERSPLKLKHIKMMVDWLVKHDEILMSGDKDFIFGHLYSLLDKMKLKYDFFQVGNSDFKEIYIRAKVEYLTKNQERLTEEEVRKKRIEKRIRIKQYRHLQQYLYSNKDLMKESKEIILSYLNFELYTLIKKHGFTAFSDSQLKIVIRDIKGLIHKQKKSEVKKVGGWHNFQIPLLRLGKKKTWEEIEKITGIANTTVRRMYKKGLKEWDECFDLLKNEFKEKREKSSLMEILSLQNKEVEAKS